MPYERFGEFGQAHAVVAVGTAAANAAVNAYHAAKVNSMQQQFQKKLDNDAARMEYIKLIGLRFKSVGDRIARTTAVVPGTPQFEALLKKALAPDMNYGGNCNAKIYFPNSRTVWADITRGGYIKPPTQNPPEVGVIWSRQCTGAYDAFRTAHIEGVKGEKRFDIYKIFKSDIGTLDLFLRYGTGLLLAVVMLIVIKFQRTVAAEQKSVLG